jgi:hypothetical protein
MTATDPTQDPLDRLPRWVPAATYVLLTVLLFREYLFAPAGAMLYGSDTIAAGVLLRSFFVSAFQSLGHVPQWNPLLHSGLPYLEAGGGDTMYPTAVLHFMLSMPQALAWKLIIHVFLAGFSMYYCVRVFGGRRWVAFVAGGAHLLSAQMVSQVFGGQDTKVYVAALFPATLAFLVRAVDRRSLAHFIWFGLMAGLLLLGHPVLSFYAYMVLGIWGLVLIWNRRADGPRATGLRVAGGMLALVLALGVAAIQLFPMYHYLRNYSPRAGEGRGFEYAASYPLNMPESAGLLIGNFAGSDAGAGQTYWGPNPLKGNLEYGGTLVFVLGITAIFALKGDRRRWGLGITMLLTWLYAIGDKTPFFKFIYTVIPPTRNFRAPSLVMYLFFASALVLVALLFERMLKAGEEGMEARKHAGWGLLAGGSVALLLTLLAQAGGAGGVVSLFGASARPDALVANIDQMVISGWLAVLICAAMWGMLRAYAKGAISGPVLLGSFLLFTTVDLLKANAPFVRAVPYANFFPNDPSLEALKGQLGPGERVLPFDDIVDQGKLATYGIPEVFGYHGNEPRWYDAATHRNVRDQLLATDRRGYHAYMLRLMTSGLGRALAARIAILPGTDLPISGWERFAGNDQVAMYRSLTALPGGAVISRVVVEPDTTKVIDALWDTGLDVSTIAFVAESIPGIGAGGGKGSFQWVGEASDTVAVEVTTDGPTLFLLSRTWHPFWQVDVNGTRGEVIRTDYTLMGVALPSAGTHRVIFRYRSPVVAKAMFIAGTSWLVVLIATGWTLVQRFRRRSAVA